MAALSLTMGASLKANLVDDIQDIIDKIDQIDLDQSKDDIQSDLDQIKSDLDDLVYYKPRRK
jgi:hypothetical protein